MGKGGAGKGSAGKQGVRQNINGPRQMGTVIEWKGAFGWIKPSKPISHPANTKGKVYLKAEDVASELDGVGAEVSFKLYSDKSGLGAADCRMATAADKAATKGSVGKVGATTSSKFKVAATWSKGGAQTTVQKKSMVQQTAFQKPNFAKGKGKVADAKGKVADAKGAAKGGGKGGKQRNIIWDKPLIGTITQWRGKFGWVKPKDTIDHPLASKHQGDLFLGQTDVEAEIEGVGSKVKFMLYEDSHGLGAANVKPAY